MPFVRCTYCNKRVFKTNQRYNESLKKGYRPFCSPKCISDSMKKRKIYKCSRRGCENEFIRNPSDKNTTGNFYCCHRCNAIVVNSKRVLKPKPNCKICLRQIERGKIYCSVKCHAQGQEIPKEEIISWIKEYFMRNNRIPTKSECPQYNATRRNFGTWNKAIIACGFDPNPILFAKKHVAMDGHKCDSLAERIIDDWLFRRKINHERSVPYPSFEKYTADFVVGNKWVEYFGLSGSLKRYDYLKNRKIRIAKKLKLDLIKLYPKDLFPKGNLDERLKMLLS